jgi:hypothetical protein
MNTTQDDNAATPHDLLSTARVAVLEAYEALRTAPGNSGDYLKAALDSVGEAIEVLR